MQLEEGRKRAEEQAAHLEEERQAALLAQEQLARHADENHKNREQMVSFFSLPFLFFSPPATFTLLAHDSQVLAGV